jgi:hypothetical protein
MVDPARKATDTEIPPAPAGDLRQWAEDVTEYLFRELQKKQNYITELEARVTTLEGFHP